ncbi:MAG: hypothetical protein EBE86_034830 [Hormoscilla sp. GUM202]|nr:hypothetical protein [Hormoscilla sp. GUM202]
MTLIEPKRKPRRGRIFPEYTIPPEERRRREAEKEARCKGGRVIFEGVRDDLIKDCYNWFMLVEPNSGDYFIDPDEETAVQKARQKHPDAWLVTFRINETGACGKI